MVRPLLLKLAMSGTVPATVISAAPLLSWNVAAVIVLSLKFSVAGPDATTGSRGNKSVTLPGSVATLGFTGALKLKATLDGFVELSSAE
jgi:hypothetical protein